MKKGLLLIAVLGTLSMTGCGLFNCNTDKKGDKTVEKTEKTVEAKEIKADKAL